MTAFLIHLTLVVRSLLETRARLEAENLFQRRQLIVLSRKGPALVRLWNTDGGNSGPLEPAKHPSLLALEVARVERATPDQSRELRDLIQRMSCENPLWGAPRIHGASDAWNRGRPDMVVKYMETPRQPTPQAGHHFFATTRPESHRSCSSSAPSRSSALWPGGRSSRPQTV